MSRLKNQDLEKIYTYASSELVDFQLGEVVEVDQRKYRFVKYNSGAGDVDAVAGQVGYYVSDGTTGKVPYECTMDADSAAAGTAITCLKAIAGFFMAAFTDGDYGFVQITGRNKIAALTDTNIAVNSRIMIDESTDGQIMPFADAAPPLQVIGVALAADAAAVLAAGAMLITIGE